MWCSVMIKVILNTCFHNITFYIGKSYIEDIVLNCHSELFGENYMKLIITGHIFLSNYDLSRFLKYTGKLVQFFFPSDAGSK
jgi:hypothetical protein